MNTGRVIQILFVEEDASIWPRVEAFFQQQLAMVGACPELHARRKLPERAAGFDVVSLNGRGLVSALIARPELLSDLRRTAVVNLHANGPGTTYAHLRLLLGHRKERTPSADGLWTFPASWMAPWFHEPLDFPELGLVAGARPARQLSPERTWERRSVPPLAFTDHWLARAQG